MTRVGVRVMFRVENRAGIRIRVEITHSYFLISASSTQEKRFKVKFSGNKKQSYLSKK